MAIPTSGQLSILKMAREAKHGDYNGTQVMGRISLYDMVNGGNTHGSTVSYPAVNDDCTPNPADTTTYNSFTIHSGGGSVTTLYTTVALTAITTGTIIYSSVSGTIYTGGGAFIHGPSGTVWFGSSGCCAPAFNSNTTTGAVTSTHCDCP